MEKSNSRLAVKTHRQVKASTTLNRKYVKRPAKSPTVAVSLNQNSKIKHFASQSSNQQVKRAIAPEKVETHPIQKKVNEKMKIRQQSSVNSQRQQLSAQELKDQAIKKALATASATQVEDNDIRDDDSVEETKIKFGLPRILLALSCAAAVVFAIVYFVNINMPDISLRVAAMQTGFDASYPNYIPRDYSLVGITSEDDKILMEFEKSSTGDFFSLTEEKSYWDSNALLANYIKDTFKEDYVTVKEQGLTIYISGSNAAWVNGGVLYKISANSGVLTKKQIKEIAISL